MDTVPNPETLENEKSLRRFFTTKYLIELSFLIVILGSIFIMRWFCFLDNCVTGTLLGGTIGYFAADIRKINT